MSHWSPKHEVRRGVCPDPEQSVGEEDSDFWEHVEHLPACWWCCKSIWEAFSSRSRACLLWGGLEEGGENLRLAAVPIHPPEHTVEALLQLKRAMPQLSVPRPPSP